MNIIQVDYAKGNATFPRPRYFIDIDIDTFADEIGGPDTECRRIEIPRELANYLAALKKKNAELTTENQRLRAELGRT